MKRNTVQATARRYSSADIEQLRQMTRAARLHHIHGERQTEIAEKMGISQAGVSRLLRMAEDCGIIRKIVVPPEGLYPDLEDGLAEAYGLDGVYVIDVGSPRMVFRRSWAPRRPAALRAPSRVAPFSASPPGARRFAKWQG